MSLWYCIVAITMYLWRFKINRVLLHFTHNLDIGEIYWKIAISLICMNIKLYEYNMLFDSQWKMLYLILELYRNCLLRFVVSIIGNNPLVFENVSKKGFLINSQKIWLISGLNIIRFQQVSYRDNEINYV